MHVGALAPLRTRERLTSALAAPQPNVKHSAAEAAASVFRSRPVYGLGTGPFGWLLAVRCVIASPDRTMRKPGEPGVAALRLGPAPQQPQTGLPSPTAPALSAGSGIFGTATADAGYESPRGVPTTDVGRSSDLQAVGPCRDGVGVGVAECQAERSEEAVGEGGGEVPERECHRGEAHGLLFV